MRRLPGQRERHGDRHREERYDPAEVPVTRGAQHGLDSEPHPGGCGLEHAMRFKENSSRELLEE
jgi:hypothetical protein